MPITAHHIPLIRSPLRTFRKPITIKKIPKRIPIIDEIRIAQRRFRFAVQRMDLSTRPPSRGNAGIRLKRARIKLM
jgi:hypothetical protein